MKLQSDDNHCTMATPIHYTTAPQNFKLRDDHGNYEKIENLIFKKNLKPESRTNNEMK